MKHVFTFWICLTTIFTATSQTPLETPEGKGLWNSIRKGKADTNQVYLFLDYGFLWEGYNLDSAGGWYKRANILSRKIRFTLGEIKYRTNYSYVLNLKGKFTESLALNKEALRMAEAHPELGYIGKCLGNLANNYVYLEQFDEALLLFQRAISWFEKTGDRLNQVRTMVKMEATYNHAGFFDKAYTAGKKVLPLVEGMGDTVLLEEALNIFATDCYSVGKYSEGLALSLRCLELGEKKPMTINRMENLLLIGSFYWKLAMPQKGLHYLNRAYFFSERDKASIVQLRVAQDLHRIHFYMKNYVEATRFLHIVLELAREQQVLPEAQDAYGKLAKIAAIQGDYQKAYEYHQAYTAIKDSIQSQKLESRFLELDTRFQTSQKEKSILKLEKEKEVHLLTLSRRNTWLVASLIGLILVFFLTFYVYRSSRQKQKIQSVEIENLQKERQLIATNSIIKGQDEERSRLARDLHDGLGGMLSGLKFSMNTMKGNMLLDEENASAFQSSIGTLDQVIAEMRRVAHSMMPEALVRFGLKEATQDLCDQVAKTSGLKIHFQAIGGDWNLEKSISVALYRIEQELLNNILKHAEATEITMQLVKDQNQVSLTVEDNGKGFDPNQVKQGTGLTSIRTRVEALGGSFDIQSKTEEGSSFLIEVNV